MQPKNRTPDLPKSHGKPPQNDVTKQKQKQKAEEQEVAGRHKNDGQKDHKGSR